METTASISFVYDGSKLRSGKMDVRDLAPALLAIADAFEATSAAVDPAGRVTVSVQAMRQGSFEIDVLVTLYLAQSAFSNALTLENAEHVVNILVGASNLTVFAGLGVMKALDWLEGRTPDKVEETDDKQVRLTVGDKSVEVSKEVFAAITDQAVRTAVKAIAAPLAEPGIDDLRIGKGAQAEPIVRISKSERTWFDDDINLGSPEVTTVEYAQSFEVISPVVKGDYKWKLSDNNVNGSKARSYKILDPVFLAKVENMEEAFVRGDTLRCTVRKTQSVDPVTGAIKTDEVIVKVNGHDHVRNTLPLWGNVPEE